MGLCFFIVGYILCAMSCFGSLISDCKKEFGVVRVGDLLFILMISLAPAFNVLVAIWLLIRDKFLKLLDEEVF